MLSILKTCRVNFHDSCPSLHSHRQLLLILTDAAAQGGRCAHVLGVLNPVAPKLGQDDQGVWASLLHNLEAEGESGTAACPGSTEEGRGAGGVPQPSNRSKEGIPSLRPKAVT